MSHMVIFQTPDGNPGYNQFETLDEAVRFVEKLRNEQNVSTARMFALEEVKFDFRPYYKVEVSALGAAGSSTPTTPPIDLAQRPAPIPTPQPPVQSGPPPAAAPPAAPPAPPVPPSQPTFGEESPIGEPVAVPAGAPTPSFLGAPSAPPADQSEPQTTRRGLFGR